MIKYKITNEGGEVEISLNQSFPHKTALFKYSGNPMGVALATRWVQSRYGAEGHLLDSGEGSPADLVNIMEESGGEIYRPKLIKGENIKAKIKSNQVKEGVP